MYLYICVYLSRKQLSTGKLSRKSFAALVLLSSIDVALEHYRLVSYHPIISPYFTNWICIHMRTHAYVYRRRVCSTGLASSRPSHSSSSGTSSRATTAPPPTHKTTRSLMPALTGQTPPITAMMRLVLVVLYM